MDLPQRHAVARESYTSPRCVAWWTLGTAKVCGKVIEGVQNHIVLCATLRGQGVESAVRFRERVFAVASLRDGQVVRRESYSTRNEALEAAGPGSKRWETTNFDFSTALSSLSEDVVCRRVSPLPDPGTWTGREGILQLIAEWIEDLDDFTMRAEEYTDAGGDQVIVRVVQEARGAVSQVPVEATFWFLYEVKNSEVTRIDLYASRMQAQQAAGLPE